MAETARASVGTIAAANHGRTGLSEKPQYGGFPQKERLRLQYVYQDCQRRLKARVAMTQTELWERRFPDGLGLAL